MHELTEKIKEILDTPNDQVDVEAGALVLLKVSRKKILFNNIIKKRNIERLKHELQKIYNYRVKSETAEDVKNLDKKVLPILSDTLPKNEVIEKSETKGKREDHDLLPDEIKAMYLENLNIFPRMRKLHEQLKLMGDAKPCDRYPYLKELVDLDTKLRDNWNAYDAHPKQETKAPDVIPPVDENPEADKAPDILPEGEEAPAIDAKKISAARKYLSDNKTKLQELRELEDKTKYDALLAKMQERLSLLIRANAGVSDEYLNELKELGLSA